MTRTTLFIGLLIAIMLMAIPANAGSRRYAADQLDYWIDNAEGYGYEVIYDDLDRIDDEYSMFYTLPLEAGIYHLYAEGGEDIEDLDMYVYDEDGYELDSDVLTDNFPICTIELYYDQEIEVEIVAHEFYGREYEDWYCFVVAEEFAEVTDLDGIIDYWVDWADDFGYEVLTTDTGRLSRDDSEFYLLSLDEGYYYIYAESINSADDIDMTIYDERGRELVSDALVNNFPICEFDLRSPEDIEIEILGYELASGRSTDFAIIIATDDNGAILGGDLMGTPHGTTMPGGRIDDDADWEFVSELMEDYMMDILLEGYEMIFDQIEIIEEDSYYTFRVTVGRGDYIAFTEGGLRIVDLDLTVYDEDGYVVDEDAGVSVDAVCEFSCRRSTTFEFDIYAYDMESGFDEGYFLFVVVRD